MQNIRRTEGAALLKETLFATDILVLDLKKISLVFKLCANKMKRTKQWLRTGRL
jgi:hypothetical protein